MQCPSSGSMINFFPIFSSKNPIFRCCDLLIPSPYKHFFECFWVLTKSTNLIRIIDKTFWASGIAKYCIVIDRTHGLKFDGKQIVKIIQNLLIYKKNSYEDKKGSIRNDAHKHDGLFIAFMVK